MSSKKSRKAGPALDQNDVKTRRGSGPECDLHKPPSSARKVGVDAPSRLASAAQGTNHAAKAGGRGKAKSKQTTPGEKKPLLHPKRVSINFYRKQGVEGRKDLTDAEEKIRMLEGQVREEREEHWKRGQREKLFVSDDNEIRSKLEDVMSECKDFAKKWAHPDMFAVDRSFKDVESLYQMVFGRVSTLECCLMDPDYGKCFPKDKGLCRMLLEAVLSHHVQHRIGRWPAGQQDRGRADRHREGQAVAQPVGVERFGRREHNVIRLDAQNLGAIGLGGESQAGMDMANALGRAGGTG